ncbi:hypothetical protein A4A49_16308 [Nicotiana attenuata]|uniref:RNase H type-1 domain-containing protein n=1 Tax=Nicotiana attenuata TaxID=49451 RepID=A0A314LF75_NICAT|nr:hypothetical protein A4A49_16308 [Nicotiana attenuata]
MPEDGIYLFIDAGLRVERKKASICMVAMDSKGTLLHAHGSPIQFVGKAMIAEAFATRKAIERAIQNGLRKIYIFSDAKGIVDMLKRSVKASWDVEVACENIWNMTSNLEHVSFVYIPRIFDSVAHNLAQFSVFLVHGVSWGSIFPSWVVKEAVRFFEHISSFKH